MADNYAFFSLLLTFSDLEKRDQLFRHSAEILRCKKHSLQFFGNGSRLFPLFCSAWMKGGRMAFYFSNFSIRGMQLYLATVS